MNGKLYLTDFSNNLYSVNAATGAATMIGATGMPPDPSIPFTVNPDGTWNLCDETLYGVGGKLYATFDSFTIDPNTLATKTKVEPYLYRIDPTTGLATVIGPTSLNLGSSVEAGGSFDAFHLRFTGWSPYGPVVDSELYALNLANGSTSFLTSIDPAAGPIFGAAPTPEPGTFLLLGSSLLALGGVLRRRPRSPSLQARRNSLTSPRGGVSASSPSGRVDFLIARTSRSLARYRCLFKVSIPA